MAERKALNIIKPMPIVGQVYGGVRAAVYGIKGDSEEARHSVTVDLADLNPLRVPRNLANGIATIMNEIETGAWIGKRPIGKQFVGMTVTPGLDATHWCIQLNGVIYQLVLNRNKQLKVHICSKTEKSNYYEEDCKTNTWYLIQKDLPPYDPEGLRDYAKSFENQEYRALLAVGETVNCQSFVTRVFATAANISVDKARSIILLFIPNLLF